MKKKSAVLAVMAAAIVTSAAVTGCTIGSSDQGEHTQKPKATDFDTDKFPTRVVICGEDVSGLTRKQAIKKLSKMNFDDEVKDIKITLTMGDDTYTYTNEDFKVDSNVDEAVTKAYDYFFGGSVDDYYYKKYTLEIENRIPMHDGTVTFGTTPTINKDSIRNKIKELAKTIDKDPVEPEVVSFKKKTFTFSEGENGIKVDTDKLIDDILSQMDKGKTDITAEIPYEEVKPEHSQEDYDGKVSKISTFSTTSTNNENGNHNMALALSYCNGTTLNPGETFSFNTIVGDSTNSSRGFVEAGVIANGKASEDYGGGICQASTTIYGAALRADMTIVERSPHMWPSTYVEIGQDAAIDYGIQDLQFRNDTDYPVYIECGMDGTTLTCTFYGYQSDEWDTIEVTSQQTGTTDQPDDEYVEDDDLDKNEVELYRQGRAGCTATAQRTYYKNGEVVKNEALLSSSYPALSNIYHYGPGTSKSKLG